MQNVVLTVHLILAALLIGVVLVQRSEGGGLGIGGGGSGVMTGRQAANALSRATWLLAAGFLATSLILTILAARDAGVGSVVDRIDGTTSSRSVPDSSSNLPQLPAYQPPPGADSPALPPVGGPLPGASSSGADTKATPSQTGSPVIPPTPADSNADSNAGTQPDSGADAAADTAAPQADDSGADNTSADGADSASPASGSSQASGQDSDRDSGAN